MRYGAGPALAVALLAACSGGPHAPPTPTHSVSPGQAPAGSRPVHFPSSDGVRLAGRIFGHGPTGVVLSNMGSTSDNQQEWFRMAEVLTRKGYLVLTYDYRGICPGGVAGCSRGTFEAESSWKDLAGAVAFLRERGPSTVVAVGASLGAMASLYLASRPGSGVDAVISISGMEVGAEYLIGRDVVGGIRGPKLFLAGKDDEDAANAFRDWISYARPPKEGRLLDTAGSGVDMLFPKVGEAAGVAVTARRLVLTFLRRYI